MKKYFILAAAALAFAACTNEDAIVVEQAAEQQVGEGTPVAFDTYVNRGVSRAGATGAIDADVTLQGTGFGVFAFYTNADSYDQSFTPNFMYNQEVTYASSWGYTPRKYWPNEFGTNALSDDVDKVSFFAYAPYVNVKAQTGKLETITDDKEDTWGIVGMKNNSASGDPMVKYISTFYTDKQVDLLWGTVKDATSCTSWALKNTGTQSLTAGLPWLDVQHPSGTATAQMVTFDFKHSLAALNVTVDTKADGTAAATAAAGTKVFIRSVTFEGFDTKGALDLNNVTANTALWYNYDCLTELNNGNEVTIQDGRKDGKEGLTAATKEYAAINPTFVQSAVWGPSLADGVTGTSGNLFAKYNSGTITVPDASTDPIFVIPNGDKLKVTIEYDVLTADPNLAGTLNDGETPGSVVKNVITRYITSDGAGSTTAGNIELQNGMKYTINLHLGLNSVRFDASVTEWDGTPVSGGANVPHNN